MQLSVLERVLMESVLYWPSSISALEGVNVSKLSVIVGLVSLPGPSKDGGGGSALVLFISSIPTEIWGQL